MTLDASIEAILFAAAEPITAKRLASFLDQDLTDITEALKTLETRLRDAEGGTRLILQGGTAELVTVPAAAEEVRRVLKQELQGELTHPSLEALAILAYRGPMTRPELEQIRGVQSSLILRNLMLRGLVEQHEETRLGQPLYSVTVDFLKHIGMTRAQDLPDYESLHGHSAVVQVLQELEPSKETSEPRASLEV